MPLHVVGWRGLKSGGGEWTSRVQSTSSGLRIVRTRPGVRPGRRMWLVPGLQTVLCKYFVLRYLRLDFGDLAKIKTCFGDVAKSQPALKIQIRT